MKKAHELKHPFNRGMKTAVGIHMPGLEDKIENKVVGRPIKNKFKAPKKGKY
jgi:hypothetical protein